jgi:hypothetical protein
VSDAIPRGVACIHPLQHIAGEAAEIGYWLDVGGALGATDGASDLPQPLRKFRAERFQQRWGNVHDPMDVRVAALVLEGPDVMGRYRLPVPKPPYEMVVTQLFESCADLLGRTVDMIEVQGHECVERLTSLDQSFVGITDRLPKMPRLPPTNLLRAPGPAAY